RPCCAIIRIMLRNVGHTSDDVWASDAIAAVAFWNLLAVVHHARTGGNPINGIDPGLIGYRTIRGQEGDAASQPCPDQTAMPPLTGDLPHARPQLQNRPTR